MATILESLAETVQREHNAATASLEKYLEHAHNCGAALIEAKSQLQHGQWLQWLEANCELTERTAQEYMALARGDAKDLSRRGRKSAATADLASDENEGASEEAPEEEPESVENDVEKLAVPELFEYLLFQIASGIDTEVELSPDDVAPLAEAARRVIEAIERQKTRLEGEAVVLNLR